MVGNENKNTPTNGWTEYGRLVLAQLESLSEGQEKLRKDMDDRFKEINDKIGDLKSAADGVKDLKEWKKEVNEVWSPSQMKEVKDELYRQKDKWAMVIGIGIAVQVLWVAVLFFLEKLL